VGKYDPLREFLNARISDGIEMSFGEVESLVGPLPKSARANNNDWWAKDSSFQVLAWRSVGWRVSSVDKSRETVMFVRDRSGAADTPNSIPDRLAGEDFRLTGSSASASGTVGEKKPPDARADHGDEKKAKIWPPAIAASVSIAGGGAATAIGWAALPRWAILLISVDLAIFVTLVTSAIRDTKYRAPTLWASNCMLLLLLIGIAIYNLVPQGSVTATVVPNSAVTLSTAAGSAPDINNPDALVLPAGTDETATCYGVVSGKIWLYFYFSNEQYGWAPFTDFHYDPGLPNQLPSTCA
jgi:hypothetical protein